MQHAISELCWSLLGFNLCAGSVAKGKMVVNCPYLTFSKLSSLNKQRSFFQVTLV